MNSTRFCMGMAGLWVCTLVKASGDVPADLRQQREVLAQTRAQVNAQHDLQAQACWQKFAVNDCLSAVRKSRRAQLDPIHQQELALNAQERAWRTRQLEERLQDKAAIGERDAR